MDPSTLFKEFKDNESFKSTESFFPPEMASTMYSDSQGSYHRYNDKKHYSPNRTRLSSDSPARLRSEESYTQRSREKKRHKDDNQCPRERNRDSDRCNNHDQGSTEQRKKRYGDWTKHVSSSGKKYYYNCMSGVSQWEKPHYWVDLEKEKERDRDCDRKRKYDRAPPPTQISPQAGTSSLQLLEQITGPAGSNMARSPPKLIAENSVSLIQAIGPSTCSWIETGRDTSLTSSPSTRFADNVVGADISMPDYLTTPHLTNDTDLLRSFSTFSLSENKAEKYEADITNPEIVKQLIKTHSFTSPYSGDVHDFSLDILPLDFCLMQDELTKTNHRLPDSSDSAASKNSNTTVPPFDVVVTVREEIGFKIGKEVDGECDVIDGFMIRSFTTLNDLDQFVARSASEQVPALPISPRLKKVRKIASSSPEYTERDMPRIDSSYDVLPEEPYYDDYNVPYSWNKRRLIVECQKRYCTLGCICGSLNSARPLSEHCNHTECMFNRVCAYKQNLLGYRDSSTERYDYPKFYKFSEHALLKEELSSIKKDNCLKMDIIDRLTSEVREKQFEIDNLKIQMTGKTIFRSNITLRPSVKIETPAILKKVKVGEDDKVKMKEESKAEIKEKTREGRRVKAKIKVKDANMKKRRSHVDGFYVDSFPFDENSLDKLAEKTICSKFIKQLMQQMFTLDFFQSMRVTLMKDEHVAAIIDATMKRFKSYRRQNGDIDRLTPELIKNLMQAALYNSREKKKK